MTMFHKKILLSLSLVASMSLGCKAAAPEGDPSYVKVLMIGNSFSISCLTYLPQVVADCEKKLYLGSLYLGGCSLERHVANVAAEREDVKAKGAYRYDRVIDNGPCVTRHDERLTDVLSRVKWDIVTIQQASHLSWKKDVYQPWGDDLVKTVRTLAPQAKIVVQETWSYTPFDVRLAQWKITADEMDVRLADAYAAFAGAYGFETIRMGRAVAAWRKRLPVKYGEHSFGGDVVGGRDQKPADQFKRNADRTWSVNSDTFHLNEKGEYLQALVWAAKLLDADLTRLTSHPACVTDDEARLMRQIAQTDGRSGDDEAIVHDRIEHAPRHCSGNRLLCQAFDFIRTHDLASLPIGRYGIAGDDCYALVQELDLKPVSEGRLELHRDYIDIQLPIDGTETFGLASPPPRVLSEARWDGRDIVFFDAPMKTVTVKPGEFIMMRPLRGAHAPCLTDGPSRRIRKLVIKVRVGNSTNDTTGNK